MNQKSVLRDFDIHRDADTRTYTLPQVSCEKLCDFSFCALLKVSITFTHHHHHAKDQAKSFYAKKQDCQVKSL